MGLANARLAPARARSGERELRFVSATFGTLTRTTLRQCLLRGGAFQSFAGTHALRWKHLCRLDRHRLNTSGTRHVLLRSAVTTDQQVIAAALSFFVVGLSVALDHLLRAAQRLRARAERCWSAYLHALGFAPSHLRVGLRARARTYAPLEVLSALCYEHGAWRLAEQETSGSFVQRLFDLLCQCWPDTVHALQSFLGVTLFDQLAVGIDSRIVK